MHLGEYLKILMIKKNITGQDLANMLNKQEGMEFHNRGKATVTKHQVSYWINGIEGISPLMARRIEIALNLKENSLVELIPEKGSNMAGYNKVFGKKEGENNANQG